MMYKNQNKLISITAALISLFIGIMVIIAWLNHNNFTSLVVPGSMKMKFNAALCFVFSSIVLLLFHFALKNKIATRIAVILSIIILVTGLLTLLEYVYDFNFGIDELFCKDLQPTTALYYSGRMSPLSAFNFILIGTGLLLLNNEKAATYQFFYLTGIVLIALLMLIGFNFIADVPGFFRLSIDVAIVFIVLAVGIYFAQPMLQKTISFERKLFTGFTSVIILVAVLSIFSFYFSRKTISTSQMIIQTNTVLNESAKILSLTKDIEGATHGYTTGDLKQVKFFTIAKKDILNHVGLLKKFITNNQSLQAKIDSLSAMINEWLTLSSNLFEVKNNKGKSADVLMAARRGDFLSKEIRKITGEVQQEENGFLIQRQNENEKSLVSFNRAFFVLLAGVCILLAIILYAIRSNIAIRKNAEAGLTLLNNQLEQKVHQRTEEIKRSEKRYRYLFENNPMPMWVIDLETFKFLDVNEMATLQYGYSREEFLCMTALDIRPEEDKELFVNSDHFYQTTSANYNRGIWNHKKKDGTVIQVEIIAHGITFEGIPARFILSNDITEKKKAEEAIRLAEANYREIFNKASDAIYVHEIETGKIIEANQRSYEITGYTRDELLNGDTMQSISGNPDYTIEHAMNYLQKAASGEPQLFEWLSKNKDGSNNWLEVNLKRATIAGRERILAFFREINERKKAQELIKALNESLEIKVKERTLQLEAVNKELEAFSYSVSHDLRAPLRAVSGYARILEEDYEKVFDNEGNRLLKVIQDNGKKMGLLIDDLLAFSRLGKKALNLSFIDMTALTKNICAEVKRTVIKKVIIKIDPLDPVMADHALISQVLVNLISNAVKYSSGTAKPCIEIRSEKNGDSIIYAVSDNGIGFDMLYSHKLFGVFQRLHSAEDFEGTGVGLAIVKRIINKHDGRVWAEGEPGKGATFYFSLPDYKTNKQA